MKINQIITDNEDILDKIQNFYKKLYTSNEPDDNGIKHYLNDINIGTKVSEELREIREGILTKDECKYALDRMKQSKSLGIDGITTIFYQHIWDLIGDTVVESLNEGYAMGELSETQKMVFYL